MVEPQTEYQIAKLDGSEFLGSHTGTIEDAVQWATEMADELAWPEWRLEERADRHVVAVYPDPYAGTGHVQVMRDL